MIRPPPRSTLFPSTTLFRSYNAINPFNVWRLVVVVMALGVAGYAARRALGPKLGLPLSGFASGFVSRDRKSTRLNSSHQIISYAVFCLKKKSLSHFMQL